MTGINGMDIDALAAQAAEQEDFTKEDKGGFTRDVPSEGPCFVRLREYIECGDQTPPQWKIQAYGKSKPKPQARWVFEIVAAVRRDEDGNPYNAARRTVDIEGKDSFKIAELVAVTTDISKNGKSGHFKLFKALNGPYGMKFTHPAQLLGCEGWKARIVHGYNKEDKNEDGTPKTGAKPARVLLKNDQGWTFEAPVKEDPETGESTRIKVPELLEGPGSRKVFLWAQPNQACWDSLFIDGEKDERDADGKETGKKVSKNWLQQKILGATNFKGSPLDILLTDAGGLEDMADGAVGKPSKKAEEEDPLADLED